MREHSSLHGISRPSLGFAWLLASIGLALSLPVIDLVVLRTSIGIWPVLLVTAGISIFSALFSRNPVLSPLCCVGATVVTDLLAAVVHGVEYAQFHLVIPTAIAFSLPALTIAWLRSGPTVKRKPPRQFSLQALFVLTVTAALLLALFRAGEFSPGFRTALIYPTSAFAVLATYVLLKRSSAKTRST